MKNKRSLLVNLSGVALAFAIAFGGIFALWSRLDRERAQLLSGGGQVGIPAVTDAVMSQSIGVVDVKALFGTSSVMDTQNIDLVIRLEDWDRDKEYDRLGLEENYTEYLGNKVVCYNIPIRPGRNLAVICESAAVNHRQKKMGYNAAQELYTRVQNSFAKSRDEDSW